MTEQKSAPLWRKIQKSNFYSWDKLKEYLEIETSLLPSSHFPLNLPLRLAQKIEKNNLKDPILIQFLPLEEKGEGGFLDPLQEKDFQSSTLLHKYKGRALLLSSPACAMHCSYCFRQHFSYPKAKHEQALILIKEDPSLEEIILSGGDPLSLSNRALAKLFEQISAIPHIKRLRIHSRFPIGIPERIDEGFINILKTSRLQVFFVIHSNHSSELDSDVFDSLRKIQMLGIPLLCQTVLLKAVNNSLHVLHKLFSSLVNEGILPYYLHQLDPVKDARRFFVPIDEGKALMSKLAENLPGYALPKYVQEKPGLAYKVPL